MAVTTARQMRIYRALLAAADREDLPVTPRQVARLAAEAERAAGQPRPMDAVQGERTPRVPAAVGVVAGSAADLTGWQVDLLRDLAAGLSRREIAGRLGLPHGTVKSRVERLYGRLGVRSLAGALEAGRRLGVLGAGGD